MIVWENCLDNEWPVRVVRTDDPYVGTLEIRHRDTGDKIHHTESVTLSYAARFGPDAADENDWIMKVVDWVDVVRHEEK